jgi:small conductance mechanosensitive channel
LRRRTADGAQAFSKEVLPMTASERLLAALRALLAHFSTLGPMAWLINFTLTFAVTAIAFGAGRLARRLALVGAHRLPGPADAERTVRAHRLARLAGWLGAAGGLVFGLALALLGVLSLSTMGMVAPIGGLLMISAWFCLAVAALRP